jgi:hypothetical protein
MKKKELKKQIKELEFKIKFYEQRHPELITAFQNHCALRDTLAREMHSDMEKAIVFGNLRGTTRGVHDFMIMDELTEKKK